MADVHHDHVWLDRWRLDGWQTGLGALDRFPCLLAGLIDGQHVRIADLGPDLLAERVTGDHPERLGTGRRDADVVASHFRVGMCVPA
jgi:hypothetical protein